MRASTTRIEPLARRDAIARLLALVGAALVILGLCATALGQPRDLIRLAPSPRFYHAMAFDSARGVTVMFGGSDSHVIFGDTWEWDGARWTFRSNTGPSPRYLAEMAYDGARGVTVLFGGVTASGNSGETWEWNGATWSLRSTSGPSPRSSPSMAYDAGRNVTVLFGGSKAATGLTNETWEWDGDTWTQRAGDPLPIPPSYPFPCGGKRMVYDSTRGVVLQFGCHWDTWEWDGSTWTLRADTGSGPLLVSTPAMAYDTQRNCAVLVTTWGGYPIEHMQTWEWNGNTWTMRIDDLSSEKWGYAVAYDAARGVTVLFGGWNWINQNYVPLADTWIWNGQVWTRLGFHLTPMPTQLETPAPD